MIFFIFLQIFFQFNGFQLEFMAEWRLLRGDFITKPGFRVNWQKQNSSNFLLIGHLPKNGDAPALEKVHNLLACPSLRMFIAWGSDRG
jgi:hypothetical protein